jgi:S1-C subfamily serine protease
VLKELNSDLAEIVTRARRSLVHVHNGRRGAGSGTIWHADGLVVTNAHVVGHGPLNVELQDGRSFPAHILARDVEQDLAALRLEGRGLADLTPIQLGDSRALRPGEWVVALGHPWGVEGAATAGIVIGMSARQPEAPGKGQDWISLSLHLRPGHSGGPLVDAQGRLVGINAMINGPDVGVAIPTHVAIAFLKGALVKH